MTNELNLSGLNPVVADRIGPMLQEMLAGAGQNIHSLYITGSAVIPDYNEKLSDINSVVVLNAMDLQFLAFLAPLGRKYGKKKIAAPLVMTPEYIADSLDAFPVEFLDFRLIHRAVYGTDLLQDLQIAAPDLRLQAERELKTKLIQLRQGYLSSLGNKESLSALLVRSITGSMAFFRAVITLLGKEPPIARTEVITAFGAATGLDTTIFEALLSIKAGKIKPSEQGLLSFLEHYHRVLESTGKIIDDLKA